MLDVDHGGQKFDAVLWRKAPAVTHLRPTLPGAVVERRPPAGDRRARPGDVAPAGQRMEAWWLDSAQRIRAADHECDAWRAPRVRTRWPAPGVSRTRTSVHPEVLGSGVRTQPVWTRRSAACACSGSSTRRKAPSAPVRSLAGSAGGERATRGCQLESARGPIARRSPASR